MREGRRKNKDGKTERNRREGGEEYLGSEGLGTKVSAGGEKGKGEEHSNKMQKTSVQGKLYLEFFSSSL